MNIQYKPIEKENILQIFPLLQKLNTKTPRKLLKKRILSMANYANYECIGAFLDKTLIGVCGLWYTSRHYIGKSAEAEHLIIDRHYRGKKIGKQFFEWIYKYAKSKGCDVIELNTYTENRKSHKFYYNEEFEIYAFHFIKILRDDKMFY